MSIYIWCAWSFHIQKIIIWLIMLDIVKWYNLFAVYIWPQKFWLWYGFMHKMKKFKTLLLFGALILFEFSFCILFYHFITFYVFNSIIIFIFETIFDYQFDKLLASLQMFTKWLCCFYFVLIYCFWIILYIKNWFQSIS